MTLYMLFAGLGILIYVGVALAKATFSGFSSAHVEFELPFAVFTALSMLLAAVTFVYAKRPLREHSSGTGRPSMWRRGIIVIALVFLAGGVAILVAARREGGDALPCAGPCEANGEPLGGGTSIILPNVSQAAVVGRESARVTAAGRALFQERGCAGCHQSDGTGVGPALQGLFGSPVQDPACGVAFVDESYLSEAILNPLATVAEGFPPIMPAFAGQLTEADLHALTVYLKSLRALDPAQHR